MARTGIKQPTPKNKKRNPKTNSRKSGQQERDTQRRREEAVVRQEAYDKLSSVEKVLRLDNILGKGQGAKRQRARIQEQLHRSIKGAK